MTAKVAFIVPRTVFVPAPNVDSAILKMTRREEPLVKVKDEDFFFRVAKISFVHRRKTLWNNLTSQKQRKQKPNLKKHLKSQKSSHLFEAKLFQLQTLQN